MQQRRADFAMAMKGSVTLVDISGIRKIMKPIRFFYSIIPTKFSILLNNSSVADDFPTVILVKVISGIAGFIARTQRLSRLLIVESR